MTWISDQFWQAFWPDLWAGLISSIVTGLLVGLVVLKVQRWAEARAARRTYRREISVLRQALLDVIAAPDSVQITSAVGSFPMHTQQAMALVRTAPISLWTAELSEEGPEHRLLAAINGLQAAYSAARAAAKHLDTQIATRVRRFNGRRKAHPMNDPPLHAFVFARLDGFPTEFLVPHIEYLEKRLPVFETALKEAQQDQMMRELLSRFQHARVSLEQAFHVLNEALHTAPFQT